MSVQEVLSQSKGRLTLTEYRVMQLLLAGEVLSQTATNRVYVSRIRGVLGENAVESRNGVYILGRDETITSELVTQHIR